MKKITRVIVVDDSAMVRDILSRGLSMDPYIEVAATAADPYIARDLIVRHKPDVLILDVEMPRMSGVEFLRKLMPQYPIPVIMVSALTEKDKEIILEALEAGAVDFIARPSIDVAKGLNAILMELRTKIKIASTANVSHWKHGCAFHSKPHSTAMAAAAVESADKVIGIGASTGGTEAIREVITRFPVTTPGVVVVQHMPPGYTRMFSDRMNSLCAMEVKEAEDGDRVIPGRVLIAPGGRQMSVHRFGEGYRVEVEKGEKVCGHCPSVEVLMQSLARHVGPKAVGVMLTGMGSDGALGMKALRDAGGRAIAQDRQTSVVFGMPDAAYESGGAEALVPLQDIAHAVMTLLSEMRRKQT